jgi:hypothetical protein
MVAPVIRCPYCVFGDNFMEMVAHLDGRMICRKCGHVVKTWDAGSKCACPKCREMRFAAGVGATGA